MHMTMQRKPYFAYGANMDFEKMNERCSDAILISSCVLEGYRFIINNYGVASILKDPASKVYGLLWEISQDDEDLLDFFEGVKGGWYSKENVSVLIDGYCENNVLVYIASNNTPGQPIEDYFLNIIDNAMKHEFPNAYVDYLTSRCWM